MYSFTDTDPGSCTAYDMHIWFQYDSFASESKRAFFSFLAVTADQEEEKKAQREEKRKGKLEQTLRFASKTDLQISEVCLKEDPSGQQCMVRYYE